MEATLLDTAALANSGNEGQGSAALTWSRQLIEEPATARTMFPITARPAEEVSPGRVADTAPVLKGVVESEKGMLAVFLEPGSGMYRTVAVGDTIGAYRVVAVKADQVSVLSPRGEELFQLRGPGEHP